MEYNKFIETFEKYNYVVIDDFNIIPNKLSAKKDLHALIKLENLLKDSLKNKNLENNIMLSAIQEDYVYINIDVYTLLPVITENDIWELAICGIRFSSTYDCLYICI